MRGRDGREPTIPSFPRPVGDDGWMKHAHCIGGRSVLFFSDDEDDRDEAKRICRRCPVLLDCDAYAVRVNPSHGVWAGVKASRTVTRTRRSVAVVDRQPAATPDHTPASAQNGQ